MISARVPFLNKDGTVSAPWYQFLEGLYPITSGGAANVSASSADDVLIMHRQDAQGAHDEVRRLANSLQPVQRTALPRLYTTKSTYQPGTLIQMYAGTVGDIPEGWQLADGTNGTPFLKDLFVMAAGPLYPMGTTGGSTTINASNLPAHSHGYNQASADVNVAQSGSGQTIVFGLSQTDVLSDTNISPNNPYLQPFYSVSYICNISVVTFITSAELK
jgi:hypothetical protein